MSKLLMLTPKQLKLMAPTDLQSAVNDTVLITERVSDEYVNYVINNFANTFKHIEFVENYLHSDLVEKKILTLHQHYHFTNIVAIAEIDILRAARLREKLQINGQTSASALAFRDKYIMKTIASQQGVAVPKFKKINNSIDLLDFIAEVGYPIVIKPLAGRGSANTFLIKNEAELDEHLKTGLISNTDRLPDLLAEQFIEGDIYHVDGIFLKHELKLISASRYVNTCLEFVNGSALGSCTLADSNPKKALLLNFVKNLLMVVMPTPANTLFHVEVFLTNTGKVYLCEAAARLGGNNISEEVKLSYGVDIKLEFIKSQCLSTYNPECFANVSMHEVAGRLLIPPKEAFLKYLPATCPFEWVKDYQVFGKVGQRYSKMQLTNAELVNFLISAPDETEILNRINMANEWFAQHVIWQ